MPQRTAITPALPAVPFPDNKTQEIKEQRNVSISPTQSSSPLLQLGDPLDEIIKLTPPADRLNLRQTCKALKDRIPISLIQESDCTGGLRLYAQRRGRIITYPKIKGATIGLNFTGSARMPLQQHTNRHLKETYLTLKNHCPGITHIPLISQPSTHPPMFDSLEELYAFIEAFPYITSLPLQCIYIASDCKESESFTLETHHEARKAFYQKLHTLRPKKQPFLFEIDLSQMRFDSTEEIKNILEPASSLQTLNISIESSTHIQDQPITQDQYKKILKDLASNSQANFPNLFSIPTIHCQNLQEAVSIFEGLKVKKTYLSNNFYIPDIDNPTLYKPINKIDFYNALSPDTRSYINHLDLSATFNNHQEIIDLILQFKNLSAPPTLHSLFILNSTNTSEASHHNQTSKRKLTANELIDISKQLRAASRNCFTENLPPQALSYTCINEIATTLLQAFEKLGIWTLTNFRDPSTPYMQISNSECIALLNTLCRLKNDLSILKTIKINSSLVFTTEEEALEVTKKLYNTFSVETDYGILLSDLYINQTKPSGRFYINLFKFIQSKTQSSEDIEKYYSSITLSDIPFQSDDEVVELMKLIKKTESLIIEDIIINDQKIGKSQPSRLIEIILKLENIEIKNLSLAGLQFKNEEELFTLARKTKGLQHIEFSNLIGTRIFINGKPITNEEYFAIADKLDKDLGIFA